MTKEQFINKIILILEDFDSNRHEDMNVYLERIYGITEKYVDAIKKEWQPEVIKKYLIDQLNSLPNKQN